MLTNKKGSSIISSYTYTYYLDGNQATKTDHTEKVTTYVYDGLGRLKTEATQGEPTISYTYDDYNNRATMTVGDVVTSYTYFNLIYGETAGNKNYYIFNGHGDVVQLTNNSGNVIKDYDYDAFGNEKNPDLNDTNVFRYCGEYFDKETGTYYLRARYYDPATSRMLSEDPIRAGLNWYSYCDNNPVLFCDPNGLEAAVVSGGAYSDTTGYAIKWIREMRNPNATFYIGDETIAWLIADAGFIRII